MDYLTIALVLIGLGALLLLAEVFAPTGGILVVAALLCFAAAVGTILYYSDSVWEAAVAVVGLAVGLPAAGYVAISAWRRMSLDSALDEPTAAPAAPTSELDLLKGRTGKTVSPMRPSGTVEFDGRRMDAMTEGMPLETGVWVRCVDVKRGKVIVRKMEEAVDVADIDPSAVVEEPKADAPASEQPTRGEPKKDDFDDFDIGLDRT